MDPSSSASPPPDVPSHRPTTPAFHFPPNLLHTGFLELLRVFRAPSQPSNNDAMLDRIRVPNSAQDAEVSIRIIRADEQGRIADENGVPFSVSSANVSSLPVMASEEGPGGGGSSSAQDGLSEIADSEPVVNQRYDLQAIGKWMEQVLPFCLLLLTVFIRQHLQGLHSTKHFPVSSLQVRSIRKMLLMLPEYGLFPSPFCQFQMITPFCFHDPNGNLNAMNRIINSTSNQAVDFGTYQTHLSEPDTLCCHVWKHVIFPHSGRNSFCWLKKISFLLTLWLSITMIKSNEFLKKQTALKGERKSKLIAINAVVLLLQVLAVHWWCRKDDLLMPILMFPPRKIPEFWHAVFIIMMNDVMVRQGAMILKSGLLIYFKNRRGHNYRLQGQLLTLIEYLSLLYRALLPTPVWYRFFLNKDYGSFFSSLTTGLYLTFKLTSVLEKINLFVTAVKALSRKGMHYGTYATIEEVIAAGDICAICQEKIHSPILLTCKHLFCEDCVCEWLERERTCPLCRALVKPADLKSFGDGSTSLFYQLF